MLLFEKQVFESLKDKKIIIIGTEKGAQLIKELLLFKGYETTAFLDMHSVAEIKTIEDIPVISADDVLQYEEDTILLASEALSEQIQESLEGKGCSNIYNMLAYAKGEIPDYLYDDALEYLKLHGGEWEHCKTLFKSGIDTLEGGISKCFLVDGLLTIEGWIVPPCNYKELQVFVGDTFIGNAELGKVRIDIKKKYPVYNDEKAGFVFEASVGAKGNCEIIVKAYDGSTFVWESKRKVKNSKIEDVLSELLHKKDFEKAYVFAKKYIEKKENEQRIKDILSIVLDTLDSCYEKINIYLFLYRLGLFNASYMDKLMIEIDKVDDVWTKLWLREQELPWMLFYFPQYAVKHLYNWERKVMKDVALQLRELKGAASGDAQNAKKSNNVTIIVEGLADETAASSVFELEIANVLAQKGYKVTVCVLDTSYYKNDILINAMVKRKRNSSVNKEYHLKTAKQNVEVWYCKGQSLKEKIWAAVDKIEEMEPEFIIDISLGGTVVAAMCYGKTPVIHIPLTGYSSGAVFDEYITKSEMLCLRENAIYGSIDPKKINEAAINIPYNYKQRKIFYREDFGLTEQDFVMVTVGNRLKYEIDLKFIEFIKGLLIKNSKFKWIVVGTDLGEEFLNATEELVKDGQIKLWGFENDLVALYKICDVYLNPDRVGGCGSMELAMEGKVPVALTNFPSDILPVIGAENCCGSYYDDITRYIEKLYKLPLFYKFESTKFYHLLKRKKLTMDYYVNVIIAAYRKTR